MRKRENKKQSTWGARDTPSNTLPDLTRVKVLGRLLEVNA
jgi:hypothetical protein